MYLQGKREIKCQKKVKNWKIGKKFIRVLPSLFLNFLLSPKFSKFKIWGGKNGCSESCGITKFDCAQYSGSSKINTFVSFETVNSCTRD